MPTDVKERKGKTKSKEKGRIQRLPLGIQKDRHGFYVVITNHRTGHGEIKMEVVIDPDGGRGRAIANQRDCYYLDEVTQSLLYRGVKLVGVGNGKPPRPEGIYTDNYPGWDPDKTRGRPRSSQKGSTGHGTSTPLIPLEQSAPAESMSRSDMKLLDEETEDDE